jgi:uncharacterized protein
LFCDYHRRSNLPSSTTFFNHHLQPPLILYCDYLSQKNDFLLLQEGRDKRFLMERLLADAQKKQLAEEFPTNESNTTTFEDN